MPFDALLDRAAAFLRTHDPLLFIAHADADGICAMAILAELCDALGKRHSAVFLPQVSAFILERLARPGAVVFVDMGSSHLSHIERLFSGSDVLLLDHHQVEGSTSLLMVNPYLADLQGTRDACAASIAYELALRMDPSLSRLAPAALIGAQADNQEPFEGCNQRILARAIVAGQVRIRQGARLYGLQTRPLAKLIANSYDLAIPGVTGDLRGTRRLLSQLGLPEDALFAELSPAQQASLEDALIAASPNPQARITHYSIAGASGALRDTREAATLLNACGRMGRPELGVMMLRGDAGALAQAPALLREYKDAVHRAHEWYRGAVRAGDGAVQVRGDLVLINAADRIPAEIAGTLCSVLAKGGEVPEGTTVVCLARMGGGATKVSARSRGTGRDLAAWLRKAADAVGGEGGGHAVAAGAVIPSELEDAFLRQL